MIMYILIARRDNHIYINTDTLDTRSNPLCGFACGIAVSCMAQIQYLIARSIYLT